tara:strand:- start:1441 stop:1833 length:393 start_codon:yes stop_codon:yes gene_type:complete
MPNEMTAEELVKLYAPKVPTAAGGIDSLEETNKRKVRRDIRRGQRQGFGPSSSYGRDTKELIRAFDGVTTPAQELMSKYRSGAKDSRASFMAQQQELFNARRDADMKAQQDAALARIRAAKAVEAKKAKE